MTNFKFPFVADGAFGTYYYELTGSTEACEAANISAPETVVSIHREYLEAGARLIITNTFGCSSKAFPDDVFREKVIVAGLKLAESAVAPYPDAVVFADIGPMNRDVQKDSKESDNDDFLFAARVFAQNGARNFIFETQYAIEPCLNAVKYLKETYPDTYIIISFAVSADGYTSAGQEYRTIIKRAASSPYFDAVGMNCICGPSHLARLASSLRDIGKPLSLMPNAGYPLSINGRSCYNMDASYFAEKLALMYEQGASFLGGCCGTTPAHIREFSHLLSAMTLPNQKSDSKTNGIHFSDISVTDKGDSISAASPVTRTKVAGFSRKNGKKIIAAEISPPADTDFSTVLRSAARYAAHGADAITVTDSPLARTRADSVMSAAYLKNAIGGDVFPHITCRDKNAIALRGGLVSAYVSGIRKAFIITGDPPASGSVTPGRAAEVYSFNSYELLKYISELNTLLFYERPFYLGAALNPSRENFAAELARAQKKLDAGASFFMTQPVFTQREADNLKLLKNRFPEAVVLAGIMPVASYKNALFLSNEVPGMEIPAQLIDALRDAPKEEVMNISVDFSKKIIDKLINFCDGFYLMTPLNKTDFVVSLIEYISSR